MWPGAAPCPDPKELTLAVVRCQALAEPPNLDFLSVTHTGLAGITS